MKNKKHQATLCINKKFNLDYQLKVKCSDKFKV